MTTTVFTYTGAVQYYTVPAGCTFVGINASGAQGGYIGYVGNYGDNSVGQLICAPGDILSIYVGGFTNTAAGGWPGGGAGGTGPGVPGAGGGGCSYVSLASGAIAILAGGGGGKGGGSGSAGNGGAGGGTNGGSGGSPVGAPGGAGGAPTNGYAYGTGGPGMAAGTGFAPGGGGGSGLYGGYGGHSGYAATGGGGGGGGSGYLSPLLHNAYMISGVNSGQGSIVITAANNAPLAPTPLTPANNASIVATAPHTFSWQVNDQDPGDYCTRVDLRYMKTGDSSWTTLTTIATSATSWVLPANTWINGTTYQWQISTYDNASAQSPWSASNFVTTVASLPAATITTPTAMTLEYSSPVALAWTLPGGVIADAYRTQRADASDGGGVIYYDSGVVLTTALNALVPLDPVLGRTDYLRVCYRFSGLWSAWASVAIVGELAPPQTPVVTAYQPGAGLPVAGDDGSGLFGTYGLEDPPGSGLFDL